MKFKADLFGTVNRKALLILGFIFFLSFLLIVSSFWFKKTIRETYQLIDHANEVEIALRDMLFKVKDCEADMRAYVITNQEEYYSSFKSNKETVLLKLYELNEFVEGTAQKRNCVDLLAFLEERFSALETMGAQSDQRDITDFQSSVRLGESISQQIESHISAMVAYEKRLLQQHEQRLFSLSDIHEKVSIFGSLLAMMLGVIIFNLIREESALLRKRQELLQEMNINKDKFFSIISHDLRNPFTAIKGYIEMLNEREFRESQADLLEICSRLKSSSDRFDLLLRDLLTWARLQMNVVNVSRERINLTELMHEVAEQYSTLIASKDLKLSVNPDDVVYGVADRSMTKTILRNLIGNAIKYTENGTITMTASYAAKTTMIEVTDSGTGMEESVLQNLFQLGKVESHRGTRNETGTGMGLILCKDMAERQGGSLSVSSTLGNGTTVKLFLAGEA